MKKYQINGKTIEASGLYAALELIGWDCSRASRGIYSINGRLFCGRTLAAAIRNNGILTIKRIT
jgi:hypothetical protein